MGRDAETVDGGEDPARGAVSATRQDAQVGHLLIKLQAEDRQIDRRTVGIPI